MNNEPTDDSSKVYVSDTSGPDCYVAFFEDDGETGYLYVSDREKQEIVKHVQIYTNSKRLDVSSDDVRVVWSSDGTKCGVIIWGGMRGIIDLEKGVEGRAFLETRSSPPISDPSWLKGFALG